MSWPSDRSFYAGNPHFSADPEKFMSVVGLANSSGRWIGRNLATRPELAEFVLKRLPLLVDGRYDTVTRLIWLFTGRTGFPVCEACGKTFGEGVNIKLPKMYRRTCSDECARKCRSESNVRTCRERYGVDNVFQLEAVKDKSCDTKEDRYGDRNYNNLDARTKTCLEKYGSASNMQSEKGMAEYNSAMREKYGVDFPLQSPACVKRMQATCMERYGRPDVSTPETVAHRKATCVRLYGVETPMQSHDIRTASQKRYAYGGKTFDSSVELAVYIWLTDKGIEFEYQPAVCLEYEYDGIRRKYMPDFRIGGKLVEFKGNQFLKADGTWQNPYDHSQDGLYEAKHQCCVSNGIIIKYESEYSEYVNYCADKFGEKFWYRRFRNVKEHTGGID